MNLLQLENVHKTFGDFTAVSDISFMAMGAVLGISIYSLPRNSAFAGEVSNLAHVWG